MDGEIEEQAIAADEWLQSMRFQGENFLHSFGQKHNLFGCRETLLPFPGKKINY